MDRNIDVNQEQSNSEFDQSSKSDSLYTNNSQGRQQYIDIKKIHVEDNSHNLSQQKSSDDENEDNASSSAIDARPQHASDNNFDHLTQTQLDDTQGKENSLPLLQDLEIRNVNSRANDDSSYQISPSSSWLDSDSRTSDHDNFSLHSAASNSSAWTDIKLNEDGHAISKDDLTGRSHAKFSENTSTSTQSSWLSMFKRKSVNTSPKNSNKETASKARSPSKVAALHANSTTGLILENRPNHLPSKPKQEELKHRQQYLQMLENAKRKAAKEVAIKEKLTEEKYDREEILRQSGKKWIEEIIPNWQNMRHSSTVQQIWWQGIPPNIRGKIWKLALDFRLDISADLYKVLVEKTDEKFKELALNEPQLDSQSDSPLIQIKLDISRTFPNLGMFQVGGPYHASLFEILGAYTQFKPTVGYIQGMSFLAAVFLLNMEPLTAFACFANLLEKPCQKSFYEMKTTKMQAYYQTFDGLFYKNLPKLFNHFTINNVTPDMYLCNWIYTLYSHSLPLDVTCRIWDIVFRDGDIFIFRTALGILSLYKSKLMDMKSIQIAKFLTKLPDDVDSDLLFDAINDIRVTKNRYNSMLLQHFENFNCK